MVFRLLSWLYAVVSEIRNFLFSRGIFKIHSLGVPVISVGNITAGGAGKTPLTLYLGELLKKNNRPLGILSRGYGRALRVPFTVSSSRNLTARELGDEPKMLGERLDCPLGIGGNRTRIGGLLLKKFGPRVLILDDAFSHRWVARDIDIVVIDGHAPFGKGFLPHGTRREALRNLGRAHLFVVTRNTPTLDDAGIRETLARYAPGRPLFTARRTPLCVVAPDGTPLALADARGHSFYLFAGIADGRRFETTAKDAGLAVTGCVPYSDHYRFDAHEIDHLRENAGEALLLTTEKDFWRLEEKTRQGIYYLRITLEFDDPQSFDNALLSRLPSL